MPKKAKIRSKIYIFFLFTFYLIMWIEIESYEHSLGLLDKYVHYILDVTLCGNNDVMLRSE